VQSKRAVATGFATVDYVVELSEYFSGTGTSEIKHLAKDAWPRPGGAALYTCRQLALAGFDAAPVTWIGADTGGSQYKAACRESAVSTDGVFSQPNGTTPTCVLIYQPDSDYGCLFDPGASHPEKLTEQQRSLFKAADLVLIAVGPPALAHEILSLIREDAIVAWIAKTDHTAYPEHVRALYSARANYIFCNGGERDFVDASFSEPRTVRQVIFETHGSSEVLIDSRERQVLVPVEPIETPDTTGAGDTFAGATMAQILSGQADLVKAVEAGTKQAARLLKNRR
jgi:ribokinase